MDNKITIEKALRRAFSLGQTYWDQADSDSYRQNAKSDETRQKFEELIQDTLVAQSGTDVQPAEPLTDSYVQQVPDKCDRIVWRNRYYSLPPAAAAVPCLQQQETRHDRLA